MKLQPTWHFCTDHCIVHQFSSVQSLSPAQCFATPWIAALQASLSITKSQSLLKLMSIVSMIPFSHLILCCPLLLSSAIFPSIRLFYNESVLQTRWPRYWSFSFSISPSTKYSEMICFRMDWLYLQFKGLESFPAPQFKSINSLELRLLHSQHLHLYMSMEKKKHSFD